MLDSTKSKRPSGRGRIAEVLASARASLKEPSRPHTPRDLDARSSIMSIERSMMNVSSNPIKSNLLLTKPSQGDINPTDIFSFASGSLWGRSQGLGSIGIEQENVEVINASYPTSKSSSSSSSSSMDDIKIILTDLKDFIMILESVISVEGDDNDEFRMNQILLNVSQPIDKMTKVLRNTTILFSQSIQRDIYSTIADLATILTKVVEQKNNEDIKQLACRHILRLYLARIYRGNNATSSSGSSLRSSSNITIDVSSVILTTVESMYHIHQQKDFLRGSGKERGNSMDDNENTTTVSTTNTTNNTDTDFMLKGGVDLLLDLMLQIWGKLPEEFRSDIDSLQMINNSEKGLGIQSSKGFGIMLDSAVFASGILRLYTNDEINRKRMIHLGAIDNISEGLKVVSSVYGSNDISKFLDSNSSIKSGMDKVAQILIQLIAAMRNFSLDSAGRSQILSTKALPAICKFLNIFKGYPELTLNCARVTAKLSLHDNFRSQINTKLGYLKCLVDVIMVEAQQCQRVMNGLPPSGSNDEDASWPSWYTWPLLSRVAFTLGNLTTSNETNRHLIGTELKCIKYLMLLLWACSGSISQLQSQQIKIDNDSIASELRDGTVKLIRLLANLCMDREIGIALAKKDTAVMLVDLLSCIQNSPEYEELLLNVVATSTNFTFYACQATIIAEISSADDSNKKNEQMTSSFVSLTSQLSKCIFHENDEVVLEACRALGNLTRCSAALDCICKSRFIEALVLLLQHENIEIVSAITGTLINISGKKESRDALINDANPLIALGHVLRRSSLRNLNLSTLVCQVLYNLMLNDSIVETIPALLISGLEELIDCVIEFNCDDNTGNKGENKYTDFIKVGNAVMNIIHNHK